MRDVRLPPPEDDAGELVVSTGLSSAREWLYQLAITVSVLALVVTAYLLGGATHAPHPEVYVVPDTEVSTTTVQP